MDTACASRPHRGVRNGCIQRGCAFARARVGAFAGASQRELANRARSNTRLRCRAGVGGCTRRLVRCRACVRSCRGALCLCSGSAGWPERTAQAATSTPSPSGRHPGGDQVRFPSPAAAAGLRDAIRVQHGVLHSPGGIRSVRHPFARACCLDRGRHSRHLWRRHGGRRACRRPRHSPAALRHRRGDRPGCRARGRIADGSHHLDPFGSARRAQLLSARSRSHRLGHRYHDAAPNGQAAGIARPRIGDQHHGVWSSAHRRWNRRVHRAGFTAWISAWPWQLSAFSRRPP